jgi:transcriptional regulator with XRE-family HTH domain
MENALQESALLLLGEEKPESSNLSSRNGIIRRLRKGTEARARFVDSQLSKGLAFQLRSLRDQKQWSQIELANAVGMNQNAISRLENPNYGKASLTTLKRLATAFDVGLLVAFVPFSRLVSRISGTPYLDIGLSPETMNVPTFEEEERRGAFESQADLVIPTPQQGASPQEIEDIPIQDDTGAEPPFELLDFARQGGLPPIPASWDSSGLGPQNPMGMYGGPQ